MTSMTQVDSVLPADGRRPARHRETAFAAPCHARSTRRSTRLSSRRLGPIPELRRVAGALEVGHAIAHVRLRIRDRRVVHRRRNLLQEELEQEPRLELADLFVELLGGIAPNGTNRLFG